MAGTENIGGRGRQAGHRLDAGRVPVENGPFVGTVMDNVDPTRSGRIRVLLDTFSAKAYRPEEGADILQPESKQSTWITMRYLSPYYGVTPHGDHTSKDPLFSNNAHAYGMWFNTPDLGVKVLCFFAEGDLNQGYYLGFIPEGQLNHMVPATGARASDEVIYNNPAQEVSYERANRLPVTEIDKSSEVMIDSDFYNVDKPVHSVMSAQMWQAGTLIDDVRGPIGSSSQRESPSYVFGVNTPGRPIYESGLTEDTLQAALKLAQGPTQSDLQVKGRRGGHSFVMDDGDIEGNDTLIKLRSATGHQITLSDNGRAIYIAHANGQSWIELGNEGTFDIFTENSINLRSKGKINLHADEDINFHAGKDINMFAKENIKMECDKRFDIIGKEKVATYSEEVVSIRSDGSLHTDTFGRTTIGAADNVVVSGENIHLNSFPADGVETTDFIAHNDLQEGSPHDIYGWVNDEVKLDSIVPRAPTHEPYAYHNEGVNVKAEYSTPVPQPPSPATQAKIDDVASKPLPSAVVSKADVGVTAQQIVAREVGNMGKADVIATLSQQAKSVQQATTAITDKGIGQFGIQGKLLETLGVIKPGLIDLATTTGAQLETFLQDASVFTGKLGITNVDGILNNIAVQGDIMQEGMNVALGQLKQSGVLNGAESAKDTATFLAASFDAPVSDIKAWAKGKANAEITNKLDGIAKSAQYATQLAEDKLGGIVDNIAGTASTLSAQAQSAINTVNRVAQDSTVDALINDPRIPSAVKKTLSPAAGIDIESVLDSASGQIGDALATKFSRLI